MNLLQRRVGIWGYRGDWKGGKEESNGFFRWNFRENIYKQYIFFFYYFNTFDNFGGLRSGKIT